MKIFIFQKVNVRVLDFPKDGLSLSRHYINRGSVIWCTNCFAPKAPVKTMTPCSGKCDRELPFAANLPSYEKEILIIMISYSLL